MSFAGDVLSWVLAVAQGGQGDVGDGGRKGAALGGGTGGKCGKVQLPRI